MIQKSFGAATLLGVFTTRTAIFSGSSTANATAWYVYNERND